MPSVQIAPDAVGSAPAIGPQQGALAGAVVADHADRLAVAGDEGDAADGADHVDGADVPAEAVRAPAAVRLVVHVHVVDDQRRRARGRRSQPRPYLASLRQKYTNPRTNVTTAQPTPHSQVDGGAVTSVSRLARPSSR